MTQGSLLRYLSDTLVHGGYGCVGADNQSSALVGGLGFDVSRPAAFGSPVGMLPGYWVG